MKMSLTFLGHVVTDKDLKPMPEKIEQMRDFPRPKNIKELQSFLGLCTYYMKCIPNYAEKASPLTALLKKGKPFRWS